MIFEAAAGEAEQETNCTRFVRYIVPHFTVCLAIQVKIKYTWKFKIISTISRIKLLPSFKFYEYKHRPLWTKIKKKKIAHVSC